MGRCADADVREATSLVLESPFRDHGSGMQPRTDSPGLGLGVPLIAQSATALEFRSGPKGGTEVVMRFDFSPD